MASLKGMGNLPGFAFGNDQVIPQEIDRYEVYSVINPSVDTSIVGTTPVGTQTQTSAMVIRNAMMDWPRNLQFSIAAAVGSVRGGTWTVNGFDQFGQAITEVATIAPAANGGTVVGTRIFARVTSGTFNHGTGNPGNGTPAVGYPSAAGTAWFGLPVRIRAVTDVVNVVQSNNGTYLPTNGGTIAAQVDATRSAFQGTIALAGTQTLTAWVKSTFTNSTETHMSNLKAAT